MERTFFEKLAEQLLDADFVRWYAGRSVVDSVGPKKTKVGVLEFYTKLRCFSLVKRLRPCGFSLRIGLAATGCDIGFLFWPEFLEINICARGNADDGRYIKVAFRRE